MNLQPPALLVLPLPLAQAWEALRQALQSVQAASPKPGAPHAIDICNSLPPTRLDVKLLTQGSALSATLRLHAEGLRHTQLSVEVQTLSPATAQPDPAADQRASDLFFSAIHTALQERVGPAAIAAPTAAETAMCAADKTDKPQKKNSLFQRVLDWYLGWLGRVFTGKV